MATYRSIWFGLDRDERIVLEVTLAREKATGYAWGRQDMGEEIDFDQADAFGRAYAEAKRAILEERFSYLPNIRDAFNNWRRTGSVYGDGPHT